MNREMMVAWTISCLLLPVLVGCVDLEPLRQRQFSTVTVRQLEVAGETDEAAVLDGVVGLLERRLASPDEIDLDVALEAVVSLMRQEQSRTFGIVERCAREDGDEEVRYVALDALVATDSERAAAVLEDVARSDASALVREHALELGSSRRG